MKSVFISRFLDANSPFSSILANAGWEIQAKSLVKFNQIEFDQVAQSDWIFFYSKTAVDYFDQGLKRIHQPWPNALKGALGPGTAHALQQYGQMVHFEGSGHPEVAARAFRLVAQGQTVLFPQAAQSRNTIAQLLNTDISAIDLVVYDNQPCWHEQVQLTTIAVLTSPLNAQVFTTLTKAPKNHPLVAIGNSTAAALIQAGYENVHISTEPTEEFLAQTVLHINIY